MLSSEERKSMLEDLQGKKEDIDNQQQQLQQQQLQQEQLQKQISRGWFVEGGISFMIMMLISKDGETSVVLSFFREATVKFVMSCFILTSGSDSFNFSLLLSLVKHGTLENR